MTTPENPTDTQTFYRNTLAQSSKRVRAKVLKRTIWLDVLIEYEVEVRGSTFEHWRQTKPDNVDPSHFNYVQALTPSQVESIIEDVGSDLLSDAEIDALLDVGNRTLRDALHTIQHFHNL